MDQHRFHDQFDIKNIVDHNNHVMDPNDFFNQQKDIEGLLSSAFDDITSIQQLSDDDDDDFCALNHNNNKKPSSKLNLLNGFNASTPLSNNNNNKNNGKFKFLNDIREEDTINDVDSLENDDHHSDLSLSDHNNIGENNNHYNLINNDVQLEDLCLIKQQFSKINSNYEMLQKKYQNLHHLNEDNVNTIEFLKSRIKLLEKQLQDERNSKENEKRKAMMFESKVNSLEYQLKELQKGDYLSKNNEEQMKWFETLKLRHQKELNDLRNDYESKIEHLTQTIASKDDELISNCNIIQKYKQETAYFQNKLQKIENEMKNKLQQEIKSAKEQCELNLLKKFDESMKKLKTEWEQKLQEDIVKIVDWFDNWESNTQESLESTHLDVRFEKLIDLCNSLKKSAMKRESQIQAQIDKMEDARRQLEKALLESRLRNSSISSTSSRSDLLLEDNVNQLNVPVSSSSSKNKLMPLSSLDALNGKYSEENLQEMINLRLKYEKELKNIREQYESQIFAKEEEITTLRQKCNKYKQHYQQMIEKHKQELSLLKSEFTKVIQNLMNDHYQHKT